MLVQETHKKLLRQQLRQDNSSSNGRKRRRTARLPDPVPVVVDLSDLSSDDLEDVELEAAGQVSSIHKVQENNLNNLNNSDASRSLDANGRDAKGKNSDIIGEIEDDSADNDEIDDNLDDFDDLDDLEEVDLEKMLEKSAATSRITTNDDQMLTFTLNSTEDLKHPKGKKKRAFTPIPKEERHNRKLMHKLLLMSFMCHGAVRNRWCNDSKLKKLLQGILPLQVALMFHQDQEKTLDYVKARKFIDGLRTVMLVFAKKFKVSFPGLARPDWKPSQVTRLLSERAVSLNKFRRLVRTFQGSRDIQAQGLVALLRSINVNARLVFSIQVPDHKSLRPATEEEDKSVEKPKKIKNPSSSSSEFEPVFIPNSRQALLEGIRAKLPAESTKRVAATTTPSKFPIFWAEVWNKYSKKWITVDPAVFKVVEVQPMRRKGKFEAPMSDESHQTWYVLAYDRRGVVKDVTRRYTQYYNAKTVKKRIGFESDDDQHWYEQALRVVGKPNAPITEAEAYELKEFRDRHVCEGIPNNMADFKNHPVYALESQLRQDEIIYPNDDTSKCGTFRSANKNSTIPIYKRSHVYHLKTPKAWHMKGRVLKVGARPLKTKPLKSGGLYAEGSADLDDEVRLYADFQTELFRPAPIVDGVIEKNSYGNVEIFTPSMMPENGYLARVSPTVTIKLLERAAKHVLRIDYAKAIVSFDFGNSTKTKRAPTATEGGILIDHQFKDALNVVVDALLEEEEDKKRNERELSALKYWNFFYKKLRIMRRLDIQHGSLDSDLEHDETETGSKVPLQDAVSPKQDRASNVSGSEQEDYFSVGSDDDGSGNDQYIPRLSKRRHGVTNYAESEEEKENNEENEYEYEGGFLLDELNIGTSVEAQDEKDISDSEGGFLIPDDKTDDNYDADADEIADENADEIADEKENDDYYNENNHHGEKPNLTGSNLTKDTTRSSHKRSYMPYESHGEKRISNEVYHDIQNKPINVDLDSASPQEDLQPSFPKTQEVVSMGSELHQHGRLKQEQNDQGRNNMLGDALADSSDSFTKQKAIQITTGKRSDSSIPGVIGARSEFGHGIRTGSGMRDENSLSPGEKMSESSPCDEKRLKFPTDNSLALESSPNRPEQSEQSELTDKKLQSSASDLQNISSRAQYVHGKISSCMYRSTRDGAEENLAPIIISSGEEDDNNDEIVIVLSQEKRELDQLAQEESQLGFQYSDSD